MAPVANTPGSESSSSSSSSSSSDSEEFHEDIVPRTSGTIPPVPKTGHISSKMRKSIKKGEVVNLALMKQKSLKDKKAKKFSFNADSGQFEEEEESQDIGFYHWLECFLTYMSIRVEYFPTETQGLIRHMQNVQKLNESGKDAVEYDLQFRTMKHQHPSIQWGEYLGEIVDALPIKARKYPPKAQNSTKGKGVCRNYNSRNGCSFRNCKFLHICQSCRSDHPVLQCTKK